MLSLGLWGRFATVPAVAAVCLLATSANSLAQEVDLTLRGTLAAERNARAAEWQAELTAFQAELLVVQALLSVVGSIVLLYTLYMTLQSLRLAQKNNEQQRQLFISDQRPWVSLRAELLYIQYSRDDLGMKVRFTVRNSGKTTALHVWIASEFRPYHLDTAIWDLQRDFAARMRTTYEARLVEGSPVLGFSILPGSDRQHDEVYSVPKKEISAPPNTSPRWRLQPHIIGCVTYTSESGLPVYQTRFIIEFRQGGDKGSSIIDLDPENSPFTDIAIAPYFVGDHAN